METASDATGCVDGAGRSAPSNRASGTSATPESTTSKNGGLQGPALWISVGVMVGACVTGALSVPARRVPLDTGMLAAVQDERERGTAGASELDESAVPRDEPAVIGRRIDLNTATRAELELLPGIGPTMAERIVEDRERRGAFRRVEDLDRIRGMGERMIERLRPMVKVGE
jgi:competence ComEA-like helix-hairpin-helix protein